MYKYKCVKKCFVNGRLFEVGEVVEGDQPPSSHFEIVGGWSDASAAKGGGKGTARTASAAKGGGTSSAPASEHGGASDNNPGESK